MNAAVEPRLEPRLERPGSSSLLLRHPWWVASLGVHLVLAAMLYGAGPVRVQVQREVLTQKQVEASLEQTAQRQMRRQLRSMEEIREALARSAGGAPGKDSKPAGDPAARARQLAEAIRETERQVAAGEMARLLGIPEREAMKRVRAEEAKQPKPVLPKGRPEAVVAQLAEQARAALAKRRGQLLAQQQGVKLNQGQAQAASMPSRTNAGQRTPPGSKAVAGEPGGALVTADGRLDALASGLEMNTPGTLRGSSLDMSGGGFADQRRYGEYLAPPAVDAAAVRAGSGRRLGPGGAYANRVHLDTWYVIGPFQGQARDSIDAVYPPERGVVLDAVYRGKNGEPLRWAWQQEAGYPFIPRPRAENAVYYAYTEVHAEQEMDVWMDIGADDDSRLWFNDRLVWISGDGDKPWYRRPFHSLDNELALLNLTEGQRKLRLHRGRNTILLKLYNGTNLMFFSVVLSPAQN